MTRGSTEPNTRLQASIGSTTTQRCDHDHTLLTTVATLRREVLPNQADIPPSRPPHVGKSHREPAARDHEEMSTIAGPQPAPSPPPLGLLASLRKGRSTSPRREVITARKDHATDSSREPRSIYDDMKVTYEEQIHHRKTARMSPTPRSFTSRDSAQLQKMYDKYSQA
jgi:hypothetical protein